MEYNIKYNNYGAPHSPPLLFVQGAGSGKIGWGIKINIGCSGVRVPGTGPHRGGM